MFSDCVFSGDIVLAIQSCIVLERGAVEQVLAMVIVLRSLYVDLKMVINNSNSSDQTEILKKKFIHFNAGPVGAYPPDMETGASDLES